MSAAITQRVDYWRGEVNRAAAAVDRWYAKNSVFDFEDSAGRSARIAEDFLQRALKALDGAEQTFGDVSKLDATVGALVEGAYRQIEVAAPSWLDPVNETWKDVKTGVVDTVKTATTWGSAGVGAALVVAGIFWYLSRRR